MLRFNVNDRWLNKPKIAYLHPHLHLDSILLALAMFVFKIVKIDCNC